MPNVIRYISLEIFVSALIFVIQFKLSHSDYIRPQKRLLNRVLLVTSARTTL